MNSEGLHYSLQQNLNSPLSGSELDHYYYLLKSYLLAMPLNLYRTYSAYFKAKIKENIYNYDMVISDHYEVFQYIPDNYKGKVILHEHNAYYLMWERYAQDNKHSITKRLVSFIESIRVKKTEKLACLNADRVFASPNDIKTLETIGVNKNKCRYTYHLGDDSQLQLPPLKFDKTSKSLLYIGSLSWEANVDGLLWFFEFIWPDLKQKHTDLTFTIIGKNPDQRLINASKNEKNIIFTGFVEDLESYYQNHRVFVAPLRFGAGMKVKVVNAMCRGIPTVTTSIGSEGMEVNNMQHIAIADDSQTMINMIDKLLTKKDLWEKIEKNSRIIINEKYTWESLFKNMKTELDDIFAEKKSKDPMNTDLAQFIEKTTIYMTQGISL